MKRLLLCCDGSPHADIAAEYALWLAQKLGASLDILHITDTRVLEGPLFADISGALGAQPYSALLPQWQQLLREKSELILNAAAEKCKKRGIECRTLSKTGHLIESFLQAERETNCDLVVLGQRGEHASLLGEHIGSTAERLVRHSAKPCLVTTDTFHEFQSALIAHDGSDESQKALRLGLSLAKSLKLAVKILTVYSHDAQKAQEILQKAAEIAREIGVEAVTDALHGEAADALLHVAAPAGATLLVMGAHGHNRIRELILGSVTDKVIRKTKVPVLLVRG
jgi:nucleotide-binding universal stress UspA family protein